MDKSKIWVAVISGIFLLAAAAIGVYRYAPTPKRNTEVLQITPAPPGTPENPCQPSYDKEHQTMAVCPCVNGTNLRELTCPWVSWKITPKFKRSSFTIDYSLNANFVQATDSQSPGGCGSPQDATKSGGISLKCADGVPVDGGKWDAGGNSPDHSSQKHPFSSTVTNKPAMCEAFGLDVTITLIVSAGGCSSMQAIDGHLKSTETAE